jgi:hypothetical protein
MFQPPQFSSLHHIATLICPSWLVVNFVVTLPAYSQEKLHLVEPIPKSSPPMMNLARHLALADLADWIVCQKLLSYIRINLVLLSSFCRYSA